MKLGDPSDWSFLGVNVIHFVVGGMGGFMRAIGHPDQHWGHRLVTCMTGALAAGYLTPFVAPIVQSYVAHFGVDSAATFGLTGFLLGVGGLSFCEALIDRIKKLLGA